MGWFSANIFDSVASYSTEKVSFKWKLPVLFLSFHQKKRGEYAALIWILRYDMALFGGFFEDYLAQ